MDRIINQFEFLDFESKCSEENCRVSQIQAGGKTEDRLKLRATLANLHQRWKSTDDYKTFAKKRCRY